MNREFLGKIIKSVAEKSVDSKCIMGLYQPKVPRKLKENTERKEKE